MQWMKMPAEVVVVPEGVPQDPRLARLQSYWEAAAAACGGRPRRADIRPDDLREVLPYIYMVDVIEPGKRHRFRLVGTEGTGFYAHDPTGQFLEDLIAPAHHEAIHRLYDAVLTRQAPVTTRGRMYWWPATDWVRFEAVHMPLAGDDGGAIILGGFVRIPEAGLAP